MKLEPISDVLTDYLLDSCDGFKFERLVQDLLAIRDGDQFVALGGVKDGGADGFVRSVLETKGRETSFVQMSIQEDVKGKITKTVDRLREFGRKVETLTYWSIQRVAVDVLEEDLSNDLGVTVRIRDRAAVRRLINHDDKTREQVLAAFRAEVYELSTSAQRIAPNKLDIVTDPSVYVFLQFERLERLAKGGLLAPVVDALIYWALRETDPDKGKLLSRHELKTAIGALLPGAASNLIAHVDERLEVLTSKSGGKEQRVRSYTQDKFCLPFAMRLELAATSATEVALQGAVRASLLSRAIAAGAKSSGVVAEVAERAIYKHFHEQGLILAAFLEKKLEGVSISDQIVEAELQAAAAGKLVDSSSYAACLRVLQGVFYTPTEGEAEFLRRLSRTSLLLFSLKHCPQLIEYFNKMSGQFRLVVGTDILVKAMTEVFLPEEHRHVTNLLQVARACGAKLLLTKPVVEELFTHIHATYLEFRNYYAEQEPYMTTAIAAQSDRILIRTYFYAKLLMQRVTGWKSFINMYVDYDELGYKSERGQDQLAAYFTKTFGLEYFELDDLAPLINSDELESLASALMKRDMTKNEALAKNDALMVLAVYAQRRKAKEAALYDGFGVRTWWLTKEVNVLAYTPDIVRKNGGVPYIMRPEFLLNFLTLSPKTREIDPAVSELLPSHVGLQIGQHLPSHHMQRILAEFEAWKELPPARVEVRVTDAVNQLKFDRFKRYSQNLDLQGSTDADVLLRALRDGKKLG